MADPSFWHRDCDSPHLGWHLQLSIFLMFYSFKKILFYIGVYLIYNAVFVSSGQQNCIYIHTHTHTYIYIHIYIHSLSYSFPI